MQILRSGRGMTVVGIVLAVAAAALVIYLLSGKSNTSTPTTPTVVPGAVTGTDTPIVPTATPTVTLAAVYAVQDVPAGTRLTNVVQVARYFKDQPIGNNAILSSDAVINGVTGWLTTDTRVLSGTTFLGGTILITSKIKHGTQLLTTQYKVLPVPPVGSMAYQMDPGRVAEGVQVSATTSENAGILPGDFVDVLLSVRQHELDSLQSSPPKSADSGPFETQQLISDTRVISALGTLYTLEMPLQDALLLKYVKDTSGTIDLVLVSAPDVRDQVIQPSTKPVVPEYFLTPRPIVRGTPGNNGVPYPFDTPRPTLTPRGTPTGR